MTPHGEISGVLVFFFIDGKNKVEGAVFSPLNVGIIFFFNDTVLSSSFSQGPYLGCGSE